MNSVTCPLPSPMSAEPVSERTALTLREWKGADLAVGLARWRELEIRVPQAPLTATYAWTSAWLKAYDGFVPASVMTLENQGATVGACLLTRGVGQKAGPLPIRTSHVGTAGEPHGHSVCVEYNDLLVEDSCRTGFQRLLLEHQLSQPGIDEVRVDGWAAEDFKTWPVRPAEELRLRECPYFDLQASRERGVEPIELLGRSTRQNLRRLLRKYGDLETMWASTLDEAHDIFRELIVLHQARWQAQGEPGAFASPRFQRFQEELLTHGFEDGKLVLFRVRHQGATVGALMLLVDRHRMLDYLSGFASFKEKPSPGLVTHFLCLTEAAKRGYLAYDFLVGEKRHKQNLSTNTTQLAWAVWRKPTLRNRMVFVLRAIKQAQGRLRARLQKPAASPFTEQPVRTEEES